MVFLHRVSFEKELVRFALETAADLETISTVVCSARDLDQHEGLYVQMSVQRRVPPVLSDKNNSLEVVSVVQGGIGF